MATIDEIKRAAVEQTGLDDFGDDSFEEGLTLLLSSLGEEARLNAHGEDFIYGRITGYLGQRLQVEEWYRRHPEIDDTPILSPVIGLGLPRTGSTALSMLLAQDPEVRYLRRWESSQPCPPPSTVQGVDPRIPPDKGEMLGTRYHVPADTHGPMECHELMDLDFKSHIFQSFAQIFRGNEARFAVAQITSALGPEFDEGGVRQANHQRIPVHKEFGIDRVGVAGGDSVPHVRETALIDLAGQLGSDLESAHELAHGAVVG